VSKRPVAIGFVTTAPRTPLTAEFLPVNKDKAWTGNRTQVVELTETLIRDRLVEAQALPLNNLVRIAVWFDTAWE
jgi:hypothetical protein